MKSSEIAELTQRVYRLEVHVKALEESLLASTTPFLNQLTSALNSIVKK